LDDILKFAEVSECSKFVEIENLNSKSVDFYPPQASIFLLFTVRKADDV